MSSYFICSRCNKKVEYACVFHFKSVNDYHTLMSTQMCMDCRDEVFEFINKKPAKEKL